MSQIEPIEAVKGLGFSEIEARIYAFLLTESPATGYRIANAIGKAAANTYKAIAALEQKGALVVENGETRLCRATPPQELLASLAAVFEAGLMRAEDALSRLHEPAIDHRVYQLRTPEQVYARARAMLDGAGEVAALDVMPGPARALEASIQEARARGVDIAAVTYELNQAYESPATVIHPEAARAQSIWPGEQLNLVVDAREALLAWLSHDGASVHHAVWTDSPYLAAIHHNGVVSEVTSLLCLAAAPELKAHVHAATRLSFLNAAPEGVRLLIAGARGPAPSKGKLS